VSAVDVLDVAEKGVYSRGICELVGDDFTIFDRLTAMKWSNVQSEGLGGQD
jgi:hypothetical protein